MRMNLHEIAGALFPPLFGQPLPVAVVPVGGHSPMLLTTGQENTSLVREIDHLIGELLLGKRKKDVEDDEDFDDEEEDEDDLDDDDEDDFDDEDDEEFEEEFDDDELDDDDDDIFYDEDDDD
jgi:hypothetical protein